MKTFICAVLLIISIELGNSVEINQSKKTCEPGFWGNPCKKCDCGDRAASCDYDTGKCFCSTKGVIGDRCDQCDKSKRYHGDAMKEMCYYEIDDSSSLATSAIIIIITHHLLLAIKYSQPY